MHEISEVMCPVSLTLPSHPPPAVEGVDPEEPGEHTQSHQAEEEVDEPGQHCWVYSYVYSTAILAEELVVVRDNGKLGRSMGGGHPVYGGQLRQSTRLSKGRKANLDPPLNQIMSIIRAKSLPHFSS